MFARWIIGWRVSLELVALEGRNSRWSEARFGDVFASDLDGGTRFPSKSSAGLGRRFSWNQRAREEGSVDREGKVVMDREECAMRYESLRTEGNALDVRAVR